MRRRRGAAVAGPGGCGPVRAGAVTSEGALVCAERGPSGAGSERQAAGLRCCVSTHAQRIWRGGGLRVDYFPLLPAGIRGGAYQWGMV